MPMTLTSIVANCNIIRFTLNQVDSALAKNFQPTGDWYEELVEQSDGIKIGCTGTLSMLENHVTDLLNVAGLDVSLKVQKVSRVDKSKALYNESEMKELFEQLKNYITLLNTILSNMQRPVGLVQRVTTDTDYIIAKCKTIP
ncbi:unnamed protein product [Aureobasidium vineae]|uniref:Uncharacterized protein n=1 Tax=Aureobasidium vineae TaxID=2773715 RepID=A0A9N8K074_9PEZI|nr:unnamed protein product [Aureobasidium vineae]